VRARFLFVILSLGIVLGMGNLPVRAEPSASLILRAAPQARFPQRGSVPSFTFRVENLSSASVTFRNPSVLLPEGMTLVGSGGFLSGSPQSSHENGRTRLLWLMTRTLTPGASVSATLWLQVDANHRGGIYSSEWRVEEQTSSGFLPVVLEEAAPVIFNDASLPVEWQVSAAYAPVGTEPPSLPLLPSEDSVPVQVRVQCPEGRQCLGVDLLQGGQTFPLTPLGENGFEGILSPVHLRSPYTWAYNCVQADVILDGGERARRVLFCMYRHQPALQVRDISSQPVPSAQVTLYRVANRYPDGAPGCDTTGWANLPPVAEDIRQVAVQETSLLAPGYAEPPFFDPGITAQDGTFSLQLERGCYFVRVEKEDCEVWYSPLYGAPPTWQDLPVTLSCTKRVFLPFIQR